MTSDTEFVPAVLDRQISRSSDDAFGHRHFSEMLTGLIESDKNAPPFSVGLLGKWGCGKSSIKSIYETQLKDDTRKGPSGNQRSQRIVPITFNAWRCGGEDIKRALLRDVYVALGGDPKKIYDELFRSTHTEGVRKKTAKEFFGEIFDRWGSATVLLLALYLLAVCGLWLAIKILPEQSEWGAWAVGLTSSVTLLSPFLLLKQILDSSRYQVSRFANVKKIDSPRSTSEQYEDLLLEQIALFKSGKGKACERLVIFVDDLDRLSSDEMVSGLDAVRTFMEIPDGAIPKGIGIVFVISCDEARVAGSLAKREGGGSELPAAVITQLDARRYLDRIFQFRIEIPPFPKRDMRAFAEERLRNAVPKLEEQLKAAGSSLEVLIDRMIHVGVGTPRKALQIINAFLQNWWVAQQRERAGAGSDRPGGLQEGAVTAHPVSLAVLSAMRVDFPDFYADLQTNPELIRHFTEVYILGSKVETLPEPVQVLLIRYSESNSPGTLNPEHRNLRRFISSLRGIRWPKSIRPCLFLSQDAVTRKLGDRAPAIYEEFISGNHVGLLTELGRQNDDKPLSDDDVRFLNDLAEEVESESDGRKNDAATVIAELAPRYPASSAHLLLSRLSRRLNESRPLRHRLGIANIGRVLTGASPEDRRAVASHLVTDLLRLEGPIELRLPSGEAPSLEEALEEVKAAVEIMLSVRAEGEFPDAQELALSNWLLNRRVEVGENKESALSLSDLEEWVSRHEPWLLPLLGKDYTDHIALAFNDSSTDPGVSVEAAVRRCEQVFQGLYDRGEESRPELWRQLTLYVGANPPELVELASNWMFEHFAKPSKEIISKFVGAHSRRIGDSVKYPNSRPLDIGVEAPRCIEILRQRLDDVDASVGGNLEHCIVNLANDSTTHSVALLDVVYGQFEDLSDHVLSDWCERLLSDLPKAAMKWITKSFASLTAEHRQMAVGSLGVVCGPSVTDEQNELHITFVESLNTAGFDTVEMQGHITALFKSIQQQHSQESYLYKAFKAVPTLLPHAPEAVRAQMLHGLFTNVASRQKQFGWLCHWMSNNWPEALSPYAPQSIFNRAVAITANHPSDKWSYGCLQTMQSMVEKNVVDEANGKQIPVAATKIWSHHPEKVEAVLAGGAHMPSPQQTATLVDAFTEDGSLDDHVRKAFATISEQMTDDQRLATAKLIVAKPAKKGDGQNDYCFGAWIAAGPGSKSGILERTLLDANLNDEQRKRTWFQLERIEDELTGDFFVKLLPVLFTETNVPGALSEVLKFQSQISAKFKTADKKYTLAVALIQSFVGSNSVEHKNQIATWIKALKMDSVLKTVAEYSPDDLSILKSHFSESKVFKKVEKRKTTDGTE